MIENIVTFSRELDVFKYMYLGGFVDKFLNQLLETN